ncbi:MAG: ribonuclease D [Brumimicrobium sp.]
MNFSIAYIDDEHAFDSAINILGKCEAIYIDLEFDKNHFRYGFNLCLMQIFDGETCFLIDPLGNISIEKIFPVLESSEIEKVCFAFGEDMRLLHHIGCFPKNVLDLAVVRSLLGKPTLSMSNTLVEELGLEAQKSQQKSNWFSRPLKAEQIQYAAEDVVDLPKLREVLMTELSKMNREVWIQQEMTQFEKEDWSKEGGAEAVPLKDRKLLTMRQWIRYSLIMEYRDYLSSKLNRPSYKVIEKSIFLDLAKSPENIEKWTEMKRVHPKIRNEKVKQKLIELLKEAEEIIKSDKIKEDESSRLKISREEKIIHSQLRKKIDYEKDNIFQPIKEKMKEDYGESFTNFLLSNRRIVGIVSGNIELLPYQKKLLEHYSKMLQVPLSNGYT